MHALRLALLALVLAGLSPFVHADLSTSGGVPSDAPGVPQAYCEYVQTEAHGPSTTQRCKAEDVRVTGVTLLRLRIVGEGHGLVYADKYLAPNTYLQYGPVECRASLTAPTWPQILSLDPPVPGYAMCSRVVSTSPAGLAGTFNVIMLADGPGRAVYSAWLERVAVELP